MQNGHFIEAKLQKKNDAINSLNTLTLRFLYGGSCHAGVPFILNVCHVKNGAELMQLQHLVPDMCTLHGQSYWNVSSGIPAPGPVGHVRALRTAWVPYQLALT